MVKQIALSGNELSLCQGRSFKPPYTKVVMTGSLHRSKMKCLPNWRKRKWNVSVRLSQNGCFKQPY